MRFRFTALLFASTMLVIALQAQAPSSPPAQPGTASSMTPRRVPEPPYKETIPPSPGDLTVWPRGDSPQEVGKALAEHFVDRDARRAILRLPVCVHILWRDDLRCADP